MATDTPTPLAVTRRVLTAMALAVVASVATPLPTVVASELTRLSVIEFPFDDAVLYYPADLLCVTDTTLAVVNRGDGSLVIFNNRWNVLRRFGRLGEGPGELRSPTGLLSWEDTLWAITPQKLVGYGLDGEYLVDRRLPWGMTSVHRDHNHLIGTWTGGAGGQGTAVIMTLTGEVLESFGPRCDASRSASAEGFAVCLGWNILPRAGDGYALINHFQGNVLVFPNIRGKAWEKYLGVGRGKLLSEWSFQSVVNDVCLDPAGGYWVLTYKVDGPAYVCRFDTAWQLVGKHQLDPDIGQGAIRVLPDGTLCLVEEKASRLHVFERPTTSIGHDFTKTKLHRDR